MSNEQTSETNTYYISRRVHDTLCSMGIEGLSLPEAFSGFDGDNTVKLSFSSGSDEEDIFIQYLEMLRISYAHKSLEGAGDASLHWIYFNDITVGSTRTEKTKDYVNDIRFIAEKAREGSIDEMKVLLFELEAGLLPPSGFDLNSNEVSNWTAMMINAVIGDPYSFPYDKDCSFIGKCASEGKLYDAVELYLGDITNVRKVLAHASSLLNDIGSMREKKSLEGFNEDLSVSTLILIESSFSNFEIESLIPHLWDKDAKTKFISQAINDVKDIKQAWLFDKVVTALDDKKLLPLTEDLANDLLQLGVDNLKGIPPVNPLYSKCSKSLNLLRSSILSSKASQVNSVSLSPKTMKL